MSYYAMASGELIDVNNLKADQVNLSDIAHHLAKVQRYNGALPINVTYSVGEHCINLAHYIINRYIYGWDISVVRVLVQHALLHDASEAYLSDIVSSVKPHLPDYKRIEGVIHTTIYNKYNMKWIDDVSLVSDADKRIVLDEIREIVPKKYELYKNNLPPDMESLGCKIFFNNHPGTVKTVFLTMCKKWGLSDE